MLRTLSIFMVFGSILFAQIPNGNFEQWTSDGPVEWATPNNPVLPRLSPNQQPLLRGVLLPEVKLHV
jgi:hypothetical protein